MANNRLEDVRTITLDPTLTELSEEQAEHPFRKRTPRVVKDAAYTIIDALMPKIAREANALDAEKKAQRKAQDARHNASSSTREVDELCMALAGMNIRDFTASDRGEDGDWQAVQNVLARCRKTRGV